MLAVKVALRRCATLTAARLPAGRWPQEGKIPLNIQKLTVFHEGRELVRLVAEVTAHAGFGDIQNQLRRAALSVVANICEGAGSGSDKQFARYAKVARGSANEVEGLLMVLVDLGMMHPHHPALALAGRLGRRLTALVRRLEGG